MTQRPTQKGRPLEKKSVLSPLLEGGLSLKEIAEISELSYNMLRNVNIGRKNLSLTDAEKIALAFPAVSIEYLLGITESHHPRPLDEYEDRATVVEKATAPTSPKAFEEAALAAIKDAARVIDYVLPVDEKKLHQIAYHSVYTVQSINEKATIPREIRKTLSEDQNAAITILGEMSKRWAAMPDQKAPKHTKKTRSKAQDLGRRIPFFPYLSYVRSLHSPEIEIIARPDLMMAMEALLLNAGTLDMKGKSHLVAREVSSFIRHIRDKYKIKPDFSFIHQRLQQSASKGP